MDSSILWQPKEQYSKGSRMFEFLDYLAEKYDLRDNQYDTIHQWSVENVADFWVEIWEFCGIISSHRYDQVVDHPKKMPGAKWFEGARLNFAENLLRRNDEHKAIIFRGEDSVKKELTYAELNNKVRETAAALIESGIKKGDRVAAFMPNMPESIIAMLASASIGAIWSSTSPDFGIKGVLDRFSQIGPKVIIAADGYFYKGKVFDSLEKLDKILHDLPTVERVVVVKYTEHIELLNLPKAIWWDDFLKPSTRKLHFEQLPFDQPLYIMYSSGTTGLPKSIVHSAGGTLIQHLKELVLHSNITQDQTVFYYTTCGWMMWNWIVSSLAIGSTLVLYDGNPFYPSPEALLQLADELNISFFGTSAKYIASLEAAGVEPKKISSFPALKVIASTGSPLSNESFKFVYEEWKEDIQLSSISGGTDIISCFVLGNPTLPVHLGEIQSKGLGMDIDCFDDEANSLLGEQGELVCKTAFPSMPIYFWNDSNNEKYQNAYFDIYPNTWHHGDFIEITESGGIIMLGRSDATLNPQGVRIGTAEIYRVVEQIEEIDDSVVVGKKTDNDEIVVLFIKLKEGSILDEPLIKKIKLNILNTCSPRHVPAIIKSVPDIPYTINGKKVELAIKKIIHGQEVKNKDALINPRCLDGYVGILD